MNRNVKLAALGVLLCTASLIIGCNGRSEPGVSSVPTHQTTAPATVDDKPTGSYAVYGSEIHRFHDKEAGATCWYVYNYNSFGMSCIPDVALEQHKETK